VGVTLIGGVQFRGGSGRVGINRLYIVLVGHAASAGMAGTCEKAGDRRPERDMPFVRSYRFLGVSKM
jgi:hypothetical protein